MVFPLVSLRDRELGDFLSRSGVMSLVATPWLLTWFAHTVNEFAAVARLYDFFLASPPIMSVCVMRRGRHSAGTVLLLLLRCCSSSCSSLFSL